MNSVNFLSTFSLESLGLRINRGIFFAILSFLSFALAGVIYTLLYREQPLIQSEVVALVRILFGFVPSIILLICGVPVRTFFRFRDLSLVLWGVFGAATIVSYYISIPAAGVGLTQFLGALQGLVMLIGLWNGMSRRNRRYRLFYVMISLCGLALVLNPFGGEPNGRSWSWLPGVSYGLFAGLAYLFLNSASSRNSAAIISLYWAVPSLCVQFGLIKGGWVPSQGGLVYADRVWLMVVLGGGLTALSQYFFSLAAQDGKVLFATLLCYIGAVLNICFDLWLGLTQFSAILCLGLILVFFGSAILPVWHSTQDRKLKELLRSKHFMNRLFTNNE
jgi:drug/metabolite transporter (DMT)-like permease